MSSTPEGKVKTALIRALKQHWPNAWVFAPVQMGMGMSGVPDLLCCIDGQFIALEVKAEGGKTTALQDVQIERIHDAGGVAWVVTGKEQVNPTIKNLEAYLEALDVA